MRRGPALEARLEDLDQLGAVPDARGVVGEARVLPKRLVVEDPAEPLPQVLRRGSHRHPAVLRPEGLVRRAAAVSLAEARRHHAGGEVARRLVDAQ